MSVRPLYQGVWAGRVVMSSPRKALSGMEVMLEKPSLPCGRMSTGLPMCCWSCRSAEATTVSHLGVTG